MGVVIRQGLKTSAVNFVGVIVGILSTLFVYSNPANLPAYGFAVTLYMVSTFLAALVGNGVGSASVKYFAQFKRENEKYPSGFLMFLLSVLLGMVGFFILIIFFCNSYLYLALEAMNFETLFFKQHEGLICLMLVFTTVTTLFSAYSSNFGRIAIPSLINNFGYKLWLPVIILLLQYKFIEEQAYYYMIVSFFIFSSFLIFIYLYKNSFFNFDFNFERYKSGIGSLLSFSIISSLTGIGSLLAFRVDTIMITGLIGLKETGIYTIAMTIPVVLDIPNQALASITAPLIAKHWTTRDVKEIGILYKKGSVNLLLIGLLIALGGYFCYDDLSNISGNSDSFQSGKSAFVLLCIAKIIDMVTSVNGSIISYSKKYHVNLIFIIFLAISNITLNYYFIPIYGILGAAIATLISIILFNLLKTVYIYISYDIHPFSKETFIALFIGAFVFIVASVLPELKFSFFNIVLKATVICLVYVFLVYKFKISSEANGILEKYLHIMKNFM